MSCELESYEKSSVLSLKICTIFFSLWKKHFPSAQKQNSAAWIRRGKVVSHAHTSKKKREWQIVGTSFN